MKSHLMFTEDYKIMDRGMDHRKRRAALQLLIGNLHMEVMASGRIRIQRIRIPCMLNTRAATLFVTTREQALPKTSSPILRKVAPNFVSIGILPSYKVPTMQTG